MDPHVSHLSRPVTIVFIEYFLAIAKTVMSMWIQLAGNILLNEPIRTQVDFRGYSFPLFELLSANRY